MQKTLCLGRASMTIDENGNLSALTADTGEHLLYREKQPFFRLHTAEGILAPLTMSAENNRLHFSFSGERTLTVSCLEKTGYAVFRVEHFEGEAENLLIGSFFCTLCETIGDVVGVVQGGDLAFGIQALNWFTLPGCPRACPPPAEEVENTVLSALSVDTLSFYESTAFPFESGSLLQLYAENRRRLRNRRIMGQENISVPSMEPLPDYDGSVDGASFALFCCSKEDALAQIGEIEQGEGLPHPMIEGQWMKTSRKAMAAYLIAEFGTGNINRLLDYTAQAGLKSLYHPEPFQSWGHFVLRPELFPEGDRSMADCCRSAANQGIRLGLHTLTSFTTTSDAYVTPVPDNRLAIFGSSMLTGDIAPDSTAFPVADTELYQLVTTLQTVQIEQELITYQQAGDGMLIGCVRGAYGTLPAPHRQGAEVRLLCDYPYRVFFPNIHLQDQYTARLSELFRNTGLSQISFDGLEGCAYTGEDLYASNRFCGQCWEGWNNPDVINDASRLQHNLWHMHTRMNWGEPWGATMREGQISSRIKNQDFYRRNLFPRMLGWFLIRKANRKFEATTLQDLEWALSKSAGFDAGFALSVSEEVLDTLGCTKELLEAVKHWEALRLANAFPEELRAKLRNQESEWHLSQTENGALLYPLAISSPLICDLLEMQPGQPGGSDWVYENPFDTQLCGFRLHVAGNAEIINPSLSTPMGMAKFTCRIKGGQYLIYQDGKAVRTDRNYRVLEEVACAGNVTVIGGQQHLAFACGFEGEEGPEVTMRVLTYGEPNLLT